MNNYHGEESQLEWEHDQVTKLKEDMKNKKYTIEELRELNSRMFDNHLKRIRISDTTKADKEEEELEAQSRYNVITMFLDIIEKGV